MTSFRLENFDKHRTLSLFFFDSSIKSGEIRVEQDESLSMTSGSLMILGAYPSIKKLEDDEF